MDIRNSKLIIVCGLILAVVVFLAAYLGSRGGDAFRRGVDGLETAVARSTRPPTVDRSLRRFRPRRVSISAELEQIQRLQELLDMRTAILQKRNAQLQRKTAEYEQLREQADQYSRLLDDLLSQSQFADTSETGAQMREPIEARMETSDAVQESVLEAELAAVEWQLGQSKATVVEMELAALREREKSLAATKAIVETGAPAVPALAALLSNERLPELRAWAAGVLGRMGADALDAAEALLIALEDENAEVRRAARVALDQIEDES